MTWQISTNICSLSRDNYQLIVALVIIKETEKKWEKKMREKKLEVMYYVSVVSYNDISFICKIQKSRH